MLLSAYVVHGRWVRRRARLEEVEIFAESIQIEDAGDELGKNVAN